MAASVTQAVVFDLDGTLVDSGEGIVRSVRYALDKLGVPYRNAQELYRFIGPPLSDSFRRFYDLNEREVQKAVALYRERYAAKGVHECALYPGVKELILALKAKGFTLCIGSSKPQKFVEEILREQGIFAYFDHIAAATLDGTRNKKEQVLGHLLSETGLAPADCLMVGDRYHDIEGAHAVGIKAIGVLWGFGNRAEFEQYGADFIVAEAAEIVDLVI